MRCYAYVDREGINCISVYLVPWQGNGITRCLYDGPFCPLEPEEEKITT